MSLFLSENQYTHFADVIIPLALPKNYTWGIPAHLLQFTQIGVRVEVELRQKKYAGIIKKIHTNKPEAYQTLPILQVIDETPVVLASQILFWEWISNYYMCTEGEVLQAALPSNLKLSSESIIIYNEDYIWDSHLLTDNEHLIAEALQIKKQLRLSEIQQIVQANHVMPLVKRLMDNQICFIWEELQLKYKAKKENRVYLNVAYQDEEKMANLINVDLKNKPKQLQLVLAFLHLNKTELYVNTTTLLAKSQTTHAQLKSLVDKHVFEIKSESVDRINTHYNKQNTESTIELSSIQQTCYQQILSIFNLHTVCLLHGVTGSGKTLIYLSLIQHVLKQSDGQVLYMLPEIALTTQTVQKIKQYFGEGMVVYHSKYNANERVEIWQKVKDNTAKIIVGARSSVLLPFNNLKLIIVDEEHDNSYKQIEPSPRYHARDAAIYLGNQSKAWVLLGSATPSLESYYNCKENKYGLVSLQQRFGDIALPTPELIDLKKVSKAIKQKSAISPALQQAIKQTLQQKKQIILFQNRKGFSPYVICDSCGWIPHCQYCSVSLTYYKIKNKLVCNYCGTNYPVLSTCSACGNPSFIPRNVGTEKIEEQLIELFPDAKIARMDTDTIKGKYDHEALINEFAKQKIDILVGTQMVVKGLDFEHVNLVGIIDGDSVLGFSDFRVNERGFQMIEQVSGRAGRKHELGQVYIQINNTEHPVLNFLKQHRYEDFYDFEIDYRKQFAYPPFVRLIKITIKHKKEDVCKAAAFWFKEYLEKLGIKHAFGPAQPFVTRVRNQFIWEILIKSQKDSQSIKIVKQAITSSIHELKNHEFYKAAYVIVDVDPL